MKKILIASDHAGYELKEFVKRYLIKKNKLIEDLGPFKEKKVDYPDYAHKLSKKVIKNNNFIGILVCGSGTGMAITANKHKKIRAALCYDLKSAKLSRLHNNANVITLGSRLINRNTAIKCVNIFLTTKFEGGRHTKRIKKI